MKHTHHIIILVLILAAFIAGSIFAAPTASADGGIAGIIGGTANLVGGGGLLGLVGVGLSSVSKYFTAKQEMENAKLNHAHELLLQEMQMKAAKEESERELDLAMEMSRAETIGASIQADAEATAGSAQWVQNIKALFRPFLTLFLFAASIYLLKSDFGDALSPAAKAEMIRYGVDSFVFASSTAGTWWFGDRSLARRR